MDSAKALAADVDAKLNDAVGIDDTGNSIETPTKKTETIPTPGAAMPAFAMSINTTPIPAAALAASVVPSVSKVTGGSDGDGDAWNDDFDFGDNDDNDDDDIDAKPLGDSPASKPIQAASISSTIPKPQTTILMEPKSKAEPTGSSATSSLPVTLHPTSSAGVLAAPTPVPTPNEIPSAAKESSKPPSEPNATPTSRKAAPTTKLPSEPPSEAPATAIALSSVATVSSKGVPKPPIKDEARTELSSPDGNNLDIEIEDDNENVTKTKAAVADDVESSPPNDSSTAAATAPSSIPSSDPVVTPTTTTSGGRLFSNFSNLAKTTDSFLTPIAKMGIVSENTETDAAASSATNDTLDLAKEESSTKACAKEIETAPDDKPPPTPFFTPRSTTTPKATPKPKASILTSPKFTPGGSLFSKMTSLAKSADSMLTKAVEQSGSGDGIIVKSSNEPLESGGWDEEDDDAFFDDDVDDDVAESKPEKPVTTIAINDSGTTVDSQEKEKTDSSSSSFVKVSPTPSISSPGILPQNDTTPMAAANIEDDPRFQKLQESLRLREEQLMDKGRQLNELQALLESRDEEHKKKLSDTKEEAKKRILRAKDRVETIEAKLQARSAGDSGDLKKKQSIIDELMEEGQALAQKQSVMERAVRDATSQSRAMAEEVEREAHAKEKALNKIVELQAQVKILKDSLNSARKGESQAGKLEDDLLSSRADSEEKATKILSLQQSLKELAAESKELKLEVNDTRKSAAHVAEQEKTSMRREHNDLLGDLEQKLRTTEREAGVREDALRHEISEIRKRWEDSVRRADALSMDVQSSTAPLLRQLESMERQSRQRASNAAELESRLRSDLEEATIENERLGKASSEFKFKLSKLERLIKDREQELSKAQFMVEEQARDLGSLKRQEEKLQKEAGTRQTEYERVERLANEGVARVRSEMSQTVTDSEERYRGQIERLNSELAVETEKRNQLEAQVGQLLESGGVLFAGTQSSSNGSSSSMGIKRESKPKKLQKAEGQAEILAGALGLAGDSDSDSDDDDQIFDETEGEGEGSEHSSSNGGRFHSFAAISQLSLRLKSAEVELKSMRESLRESNETRQSLVEELGEARHAKEKLPLFEAKVMELTQENREMEQELAGLKEDISDVRELYRTQLNILIEEKTASSSEANKSANEA